VKVGMSELMKELEGVAVNRPRRHLRCRPVLSDAGRTIAGITDCPGDTRPIWKSGTGRRDQAKNRGGGQQAQSPQAKQHVLGPDRDKGRLSIFTHGETPQVS
jgi:hypothetical protein